MDLSLPELDLLLAKVTAGDQTPATMALADRIREAQDNVCIGSTLKRNAAYTTSVLESQ